MVLWWALLSAIKVNIGDHKSINKDIKKPSLYSIKRALSIIKSFALNVLRAFLTSQHVVY